MKYFSAAVLLGALYYPLVLPGATWDVQQLMSMLGQVKKSEATFVERRYSSYLDTPLVITGTLSFSAPDRLVKHTRTPIDERFEVDGRQLVIEHEEKGRRVRREISLDNYPFLAPLIQGVRSTLAGDLNELEQYYTVTLNGRRDQWNLQLVPLFEPSDEDSALSEIVKEIRIKGSHAQITRVEIHETDGDRSIMIVTPR